MKIKCPSCGQSGFHQLARREYPPMAPQIVGGIAMSFVYQLSRKGRFHCDKCGEIFYSHTIGSRFWFALWTLFWLLLAWAILRLVIAGNL